MKQTTQKGFTLVEILVVIAILSLLIATVVANLGAGQETASQLANKKKMMDWYSLATTARAKNKPLPEQGGVAFVYYPWVSGVVERNPQNLEALFLVDSPSPWLAEMHETDVRSLNLTYDEIRAHHTDFAGRFPPYTLKMFKSYYEPLIAARELNQDGTVSVLFGNGQVRYITPPDLPDDGDYDSYVLEFGPNSAVEALQKLGIE